MSTAVTDQESTVPYRITGDARTAEDLVSAALGPAVEHALGSLPAGVRMCDSGVALALRLGAGVAPSEQPGGRCNSAALPFCNSSTALGNCPARDSR